MKLDQRSKRAGVSDLQANILRTLRVFGPCSNAEVARKLGESMDRTYRAIKKLELEGLAVHPKLQVWDISRLGREWFEKQEHRPLRVFE